MYKHFIKGHTESCFPRFSVKMSGPPQAWLRDSRGQTVRTSAKMLFLSAVEKHTTHQKLTLAGCHYQITILICQKEETKAVIFDDILHSRTGPRMTTQPLYLPPYLRDKSKYLVFFIISSEVSISLKKLRERNTLPIVREITLKGGQSY